MTAGVAVLPLMGAAASATAAPPALPPPVAERRSATIHAFAKPLQFLSYDDTAALIAEAGYGGVDYTVRPGGHVEPAKVADDLPRAVAAAKKAGLAVEMISTAITSARDKHTEPLLRTAAQLGVKIYRYGAFTYDETLGIWPTLQKHRAAIQELAALNQSLGLHGAIQNHAGPRVGGPLWDLYELLRDVDPRWSGVQYDIRHAVAEGGQSWPLALRLLAPWIKSTDLKDFKWQQTSGKAVIENVPLGEGIVPFEAYFKRVRELQLSGPISVHFEYAPFEHAAKPLTGAEKRPRFLEAMKQDLAVLKRYLAAARLG